MGDKLIVGPISKGLKTNVTPFNIDNDSFPVLQNAYQWRGRIKRKRGTSLLGRLNRNIGTTDGSGNATITILPNPGIGIASFTVGTNIFTDPGTILVGTQTLTTNGPGTATLVRSTGVLTISGSNITTAVIYFPSLPVMGLEVLQLTPNSYPGTLAFDTTYSYNILHTFPYSIYDVSFYKNPPSATYPSYVQKSPDTPTTWNGQDYQQFWTVNYQGALWATNGVTSPFTKTNIGMQYKPIVAVTVSSGGPPAIVNLQITSHGLVVGDFVFVNEVVTTTGINYQTGYVIAVVNANNVTVEFPNATIATNGTGGIAQYLTNRSDVTKDSLRWYDGDPTTTNNGWVNFAPPLNIPSLFPNFSIADLPPGQYYLVGARMIIAFKDRLLFFGPVVQTSAANSQVYLQDTVIYSQNGTPYYTASFTGDPTLSTTVFHPILTPDNQSASAAAYFEDTIGFGGFKSAGTTQQIVTCSTNEDALVVGFQYFQTRFIYTGNDVDPFEFYIINNELGSGSTFSVINMDAGVITRGTRGYILTSQTACGRIDIDIPDQVFEINLNNHGAERFTSSRDFISEWIYFTYPSNQINVVYPNQTLQYNYRDDSWAIFYENYTTYGSFRRQDGQTWATLKVGTWDNWNVPWNAGASTLLQQQVIAGNQQGFVVFREGTTNESVSLTIQNIVGSVVTCPNHCLNEGDFITISGAQGTVATQVNGLIFSVFNVTTNTFTLNPNIVGGTYTGGGLITRMYVPFIQSKQFPTSWGDGRKTRIGVQQYLLTATPLGKIQLLIYLSQNASGAYNLGNVVPNNNEVYNNSLVYGSTLYTCVESCNLGLTPFNSNLMMNSIINSMGTNATTPQAQIWHRMNTSLIGDTIQIALTMSEDQMRDPSFNNQFSEIEFHGMIIDTYPSRLLS